MNIIATAAAALALGLSATTAFAQSAVQLIARPYIQGLSRPVWIGSAPGDDDRLFILEQHTGQVRIFKKSTGTLNATPFLTIGGLSTGNEQGLLGIAFHPDYQNNGYVYVSYTNPATRVVRYTRSTPDTANAGSAFQIFSVSQPFSNHNGGQISFGPDGYLYIGLGDGGSANDPGNRAQTMTDVLGKMLRIDVDGGSPYAIPPTNPFLGTSAREEIWHAGLRNPWRWSFDKLTGDMYLGDVGQNAIEEIDFQPSGLGGLNYGWRCMEGNNCTGLTGCTCNAPALVLPIQTYSHSFGCSVTGGYVYRGCDIPELRGTYFYADYCSARIWSMRYENNVVTEWRERTAEMAPSGVTVSTISSFGEDNEGNVYIVSLGGRIFRIERRGCYADCDQSTGVGVLDVFDYLCFANAFAAGDRYADCDCSTGPGVLDIFDFLCFGNKFDQGCP